MSLKAKDDIYRESLFDSFKGLDTTSSITNMQPGYLRIADNCDIDETGALKKRQGYIDTLTVADWLTNNIRFGLEYFLNPTTSQIVVFGEDGVTGTLGRATTSVAPIAAALSLNRPSIVQFQTLLFYFNGVASFLYNGVTTRQIGITPPAVAPTDGGNFATPPPALTIGANYIWAYTYYNSVTGAESSPSPLSASIVIGPGDGRTINLTPGSALTADTIRVYRTTANGPILFLEGSVGIAAVAFNSIAPDAALTLELELDNTRITTWGQPRYAVVSQNRIFATRFTAAGGTVDTPNRVRFTKQGQSGAMPESWQAIAFADCESSGGLKDINIGIGQANEMPIVLKKNSIGRLDQVGSITSEIGVDNVIFEYKEISRSITTVSHWAQCNVLGNLVWLGKDNIYMTDGQQAIPIADSIIEDIKGFNYNFPEKLSGHNDIVNKRVYFTVTTNAITGEANKVLVGSYRKFPEFNWTIYTAGVNPVIHPGITAGCFFDVLGPDANNQVYFGNNIGNGMLYKMNTGHNDDGDGIYFRVRDYPSNFGLDEETKLFFKDIIHAAGNGGNYNLQIFSVYDLNDLPTDPGLLNLYAPGALWDFAIWDSALWADEGFKVRHEYSKHRKATYEQLEFRNINADQPVTIFGYIKAARPQEFK